MLADKARPREVTPEDLARYISRLSYSNASLSPSQWLPDFRTDRPGLDYENENKPYVEARRHVWPDDTDLELFMQNPQDTDDRGLSLEVKRVVDFCNGKTLPSIGPDEPGDSQDALVAWLDERAYEDGVFSSRSYRGPLTSHGLSRELRKNRYHHGKGRATRPRHPPPVRYVGCTNAPGSVPNQVSEPDADRRLIFVTDLNSSCIQALINTASTHQASALRDAVAKHLAFEPVVEVKIQADGLAMFELSFHIPGLLCRPSQTTDHRRFKNGEPLRRRNDISFLNWEDGLPAEFLYENQVSCVIAGLHEHNWVAYCFVDTYFDGGNERRETVAEYHKDKVSEDGMNTDPLTYGTCDADKPLWDPRKYFLTVYLHRTTPVIREWLLLIEKIEHGFRIYEQSSQSELSSQEPKGFLEAIRAASNWVLRVMHLSAQLQGVLAKTVDVLDNFCSTSSVIFDDFPLEFKKFRSRANEFRSFEKRLDHLAYRCDRHARMLEFQLNQEAVLVSRGQSQLAIDNKRFSLVMLLYISPVALTASIFSMEKPILPLVRPTLAWFAGLILLFSLGGFVVHGALFWQWREIIKWPRRFFTNLIVLLRITRRERKPPDVERAVGSTPEVASTDASGVGSSDTGNALHA
ncbi:hypothetical protein LTR96_008691 [Exophiala xenobiotica]|nr:hypothetical protein LTR92_000769 [Exophiala xenobiotica]KAK5265792.1 hypothetical protein LTR96_008691 [Exophiala xenobiotica]KAK5552015.1 hypothetical protein LTR46_009880 [Exophiala xenobiotica]